MQAISLLAAAHDVPLTCGVWFGTHSELKLMQATDVQRQQRALALGLSSDAAWEQIAEATAATTTNTTASMHETSDTSRGATTYGQLAGTLSDVHSDDEFHDVEES